MPNDNRLRLAAAENAGAGVRPATWDDATGTVDVCFYSGATVARMGWDGPYRMRVDLDGMDLGRLNRGAGVFVDHFDMVEFGQVGVVERAWIANGRAYATIRFASDEAAATVRGRVREGVIRNVSMGVFLHARDEAEEDGVRVVTVTASEPFEISLVGVPADRDAQVLSAGAGPGAGVHPASRPTDEVQSMTKEQAEALLAAAKAEAERLRAEVDRLRAGATASEDEAGRARAELELGRAELAAAQAETALARAETEAARAAATEAQAEAARLNREREIVAAVADFGFEPATAGTLDAEGVDAGEARIRLQRMAAERARAGRIDPRVGTADSRGQGRRAAMAAALAHRAGGQAELPDDAREFRGMSLSRLAAFSLEQAGRSTTGMTASEIASEVLSAGHVTGDFPLALGTALDRSLRAAYSQPAVAYPTIARRTVLANFRAHTRIQMGDMPLPQPVAENATIRYGTWGEEGNSIQLRERALMIAISRQMIVNDDLQAFADIPRALGIGIRSLEEQLVIGVLTANAALSDGVALFHASHANLGTAARVTETSVAAGRKAMRGQKGVGSTAKGEEPRFISAPPRIILTGPDEQTDAEKLVAGITPATAANVNVFSGRLTVATSDYLSGSPEPWFLFADPAVAPVLEYAYLDGQEGPVVEMRPGWNTTGLEYRILHDFGTAAIDHRGAWKNPGSA